MGASVGRAALVTASLLVLLSHAPSAKSLLSYHCNVHSSRPALRSLLYTHWVLQHRTALSSGDVVRWRDFGTCNWKIARRRINWPTFMESPLPSYSTGFDRSESYICIRAMKCTCTFSLPIYPDVVEVVQNIKPLSNYNTNKDNRANSTLGVTLKKQYELWVIPSGKSKSVIIKRSKSESSVMKRQIVRDHCHRECKAMRRSHCTSLSSTVVIVRKYTIEGVIKPRARIYSKIDVIPVLHVLRGVRKWVQIQYGSHSSSLIAKYASLS